MKRIIILTSIITLFLGTANAQPEDIDPDYLNTLTKRAGKIVDGLNMTNLKKKERVQQIIVIQYFELSKIHDLRDKNLEEVKELGSEEKEDIKQTIHHEINSLLYQLHAEYLAKLSAELSQDQIEQVKDGMTYGVAGRTYNRYLSLLPELTEDQKRYIYSNLVEAREFAMDAGSSDEKHAWFGKYKGRINNFLSGEGYDLKKAEQALKNQKDQ